MDMWGLVYTIIIVGLMCALVDIYNPVKEPYSLHASDGRQIKWGLTHSIQILIRLTFFLTSQALCHA